MFAAFPQGQRASFSVKSTSSTCEVFQIKAENRKHLPDSLIRNLRETTDRLMSRRSNQCAPLAPIGSVFATPHAAPHVGVGSQQGNKQLLRTRSGKVPRPLCGKIPPAYARGGPSSPLGAQAPSASLPNASPRFAAKCFSETAQCFKVPKNIS